MHRGGIFQFYVRLIHYIATGMTLVNPPDGKLVNSIAVQCSVVGTKKVWSYPFMTKKSIANVEISCFFTFYLLALFRATGLISISE